MKVKPIFPHVMPFYHSSNKDRGLSCLDLLCFPHYFNRSEPKEILPPQVPFNCIHFKSSKFQACMLEQLEKNINSTCSGRSAKLPKSSTKSKAQRFVCIGALSSNSWASCQPSSSSLCLHSWVSASVCEQSMNVVETSSYKLDDAPLGNSEKGQDEKSRL